jgi:hypothetical protein
MQIKKTDQRLNDFCELLVELDSAFRTFHSQTATLADRATPENEAVDVGADREVQKRVILGIAYRINKASRGEV